MNTDISVDLDNLDPPAKILLRLLEAKQEMQKHLAAWQLTINRNPALFRKLEQLDIEPRLNTSDGCIDINFSGSPDLLTQVWQELRRAGYKNDVFPKDGTFCTHWRADGQSRIWMFFSSSVCKRVQIGTKMVEQPIYETQCGELPEQTALGELLPAEDQLPRIEEIL